MSVAVACVGPGREGERRGVRWEGPVGGWGGVGWLMGVPRGKRQIDGGYGHSSSLSLGIKRTL